MTTFELVFRAVNYCMVGVAWFPVWCSSKAIAHPSGLFTSYDRALMHDFHQLYPGGYRICIYVQGQHAIELMLVHG